MEYNIDILVAGCNTTCMHCYVNGGKAPAMSFQDFCLCMEKLSLSFENLKGHISFTLDNELFNHPDALQILTCVEQNYKSTYYHHGSTTGIAFLTHSKQTELFDILKRNEWDYVSFTIHGNRDTHDKIVNNSHGLESIIAASKLFREHDFKIWVSLMMNKKLVSELEDMSYILSHMHYDSILPVIPDYFPTPRLMKYQQIRLNKYEFVDVIAFLLSRKVDVSDIEKQVTLYNEETIIQTVHADVLREELTSKSTAFFHIDYKLDFFLGNTGSPLMHLGNIKTLSSQEIHQCIVMAEDNYYETESIHYNDIMFAVSHGELKRSGENYVYPSKIAGIIAMIKNKESDTF